MKHPYSVIEHSCRFLGCATANSHSSTEAEIMFLDAGGRLEGLPASDFFGDALISHQQTKQSTRNHPQIEQPHFTDHVPPNISISNNRVQSGVFEDKEAATKMTTKGRSPTLRYVSRTQCVDLDWSLERVNLDVNMSIRYVNTREQMAEKCEKYIDVFSAQCSEATSYHLLHSCNTKSLRRINVNPLFLHLLHIQSVSLQRFTIRSARQQITVLKPTAFLRALEDTNRTASFLLQHFIRTPKKYNGPDENRATPQPVAYFHEHYRHEKSLRRINVNPLFLHLLHIQSVSLQRFTIRSARQQISVLKPTAFLRALEDTNRTASFLLQHFIRTPKKYNGPDENRATPQPVAYFHEHYRHD